MNFEAKMGLEKNKSGREKLLELEKTGQFVFHGSLDKINILEPRQSYNCNKETGKEEKDGDPAVFATPFADMAIFRALIHEKGLEEDSESSFGIDDDGKLHFFATKNLIDRARGIIARVYVLNRDDFDNFDYIQCRSSKEIIPVEVIEVNVDDLPDNIKIID